MQALKEAQKLACSLAEEFSFDRLYLCGSVLRPHAFTSHSDLDLVIKGLDEGLFLKAYAFLLKRSSIPVDLKPWESLHPGMRRRVLQEGMVLYERRKDRSCPADS